eukprot:TRINITY_DN4723_c0_g1_i3.p1 TRINITY_DN4723_c0_g1~~TRINITY_DN4723_c0_g1_i3.p1  ORF type:complete len:178 (-),score=43.34 TRINITY_DN4723_c0_g1_i3:65-598(-)
MILSIRSLSLKPIPCIRTSNINSLNGLVPKNRGRKIQQNRGVSSSKINLFADNSNEINRIPVANPRRSVASATPVMTMEKPLEKSNETEPTKTIKPIKLFPQKYLEKKEEANEEKKEEEKEIVEVSEANTPVYTGLEGVLGNKVLVVRRKMEWGTVILGYQQANKYELVNEEGHVSY